MDGRRSYESVDKGYFMNIVARQYSTIATCAVTGIGILACAHYFGAFDLARLDTPLGVRQRNAALAFGLMIVFFIYINRYLYQRAVKCFSEFLSKYPGEMKHQTMMLRLQNGFSKCRKFSWIGGGMVTVFYLLSEGLLSFDAEPLSWYLSVLGLIFWRYAICTLFCLLFVTRFALLHFLNERLIDLFGIEKFKHLSDLVISNAIVSALSLSLIPIFWLGTNVPIIDKVIVSCVFVALTYFLYLPVHKVQRCIAKKKSLAILRINDSIKALFLLNEQHKRRLTDDPVRLRKLSSLINSKQQISAVSEWAIDIPQGMKTIAIVFSVPLSWVIGALVDKYLQEIIEISKMV